MEEESKALSLLREGLPEEGLTAAQVHAVRRTLYGLWSWTTERYTMGESTSVTVETARELFESLCFTLSLALRARGEGLAAIAGCEDPRRMAARGRRELELLVETGKSLYERAAATLPAVENRSLRDTVTSLGVFFRRYDHRFFAHQIPADIDYQLCRPVPETLPGIEYVNEYLRRLLLEHQFLSRFEPKTLVRLLERYCPDYRGLLINLYEPAAVNAVGLALCGGDLRSLDITPENRAVLTGLFRDYSPRDAERALREAAERVCAGLGIGEEKARDYLRETAADLWPRIAAVLPHNQLKGIFLSL